MEKILNKLESLGDALGGKYTIGETPEFVYNGIVEIVEMIKTFKKEHPSDDSAYDDLVSKTINCFGFLNVTWIKSLQNPQIMTMQMKGLNVGDCLLDVWNASIKKLLELEMSNEQRNDLLEFSSSMNKYKATTRDSGCLGVLVLLITGAITLIGLSCFGIHQLFS